MYVAYKPHLTLSLLALAEVKFSRASEYYFIQMQY